MNILEMTPQFLQLFKKAVNNVRDSLENIDTTYIELLLPKDLETLKFSITSQQLKIDDEKLFEVVENASEKYRVYLDKILNPLGFYVDIQSSSCLSLHAFIGEIDRCRNARYMTYCYPYGYWVYKLDPQKLKDVEAFLLG